MNISIRFLFHFCVTQDFFVAERCTAVFGTKVNKLIAGYSNWVVYAFIPETIQYIFIGNQGYETRFTWLLSRLWGRVHMSPIKVMRPGSHESYQGLRPGSHEFHQGYETGFTWLLSRLWGRVPMSPIKVMRPGSHETYQGYEDGFTWVLPFHAQSRYLPNSQFPSNFLLQKLASHKVWNHR